MKDIDENKENERLNLIAHYEELHLRLQIIDDLQYRINDDYKPDIDNYIIYQEINKHLLYLKKEVKMFKCYKCNTILNNQEDLERIAKKLDAYVFQCPKCTEKLLKKSEENNMVIKFKKGIDENGKDYCRMKFDILKEVNEKCNNNMNIYEDGYTDCISRNYERLVEYLYKVNISGYITNNTFTVRFGNQCKDFTFGEAKLSKGGLQERVTAIKEWVNSLPKEESWQIDLKI